MPDEPRVLDITELLAAMGGAGERPVEQMVDAIDAASDQGQLTWLVHGGKPVAAIVPVDVAEDVQARLAAVLARFTSAQPWEQERDRRRALKGGSHGQGQQEEGQAQASG